MGQKQELITKIDGLVLITGDHRIRLKEVVKTLESESDLEIIERLISQEENIIKGAIEAIIETEIKAGDDSVLEIIDSFVGKIKKEERIGSQIIEDEERVTEDEKVEELLSQIE